MKRRPVAVRLLAAVSRRLPSPHVLRLVLAALLGVVLLGAALAVPATLAARNTSGAESVLQTHAAPNRSAPAEPVATDRGTRAPARVSAAAAVEALFQRGLPVEISKAAPAQAAAPAALLAPDATINVNSTADVIANDGQCTLREAIIAANTDTASGASAGECQAGTGTDTIDVPAGTYNLTLGTLNITDSVVIVGAGAMSTLIDGGGTTVDILTIDADGISVSISGLTIQNSGDDGIDVENQDVTLTLIDSQILDNDDDGVFLNDDDITLQVIGSTISRNGGEGIGQNDDGLLEITNSTISLNGDDGIAVDSDVDLLHVTIFNNGGDGIDHGAGNVDVENTIIANNGAKDCENNPINDKGDNLDSDGTCNVDTTADPLLGPLADNGGPTLTHALLPGSPAIDAVNVEGCGLAVDQRNVPRPQDGDGDGDALCDIGAYERALIDLSITKFEADECPICFGPELDAPNTLAEDPPPLTTFAGQELVYGIDVYNFDSDTAFNVVVTDTLPAGVQYLADTDNCSVDGTSPAGGQILRCELGDLGGYEDVTFFIKTRIAPDAVATEPNGTRAITNTAEVDSDSPEEDPDDNVDTYESFIQDLADLSVVKMSKPDTTVEAGETFTYTIIIENLGPSYARGVYFRDETVLEDLGSITDVHLIKDPFRPGFYQQFNVTYDSSSNTVILEGHLREPLEPTGPDIFDFPGRWVVKVEVEVAETQDIDNVVRVDTGPGEDFRDEVTWENGTPDPDTSNNQAQDFISVMDTADLRLTKNAPTSVTAGTTVVYTMTVTNDGPSAAENVQVIDVLPAGLVEGSIDVFQPGCTVGTPGDPFDPLICNLNTLAVDATQTITFAATVDPSFVVDQPNAPLANILRNDARVESDTFDPDNSLNRANTETTVTASADLFAVKGAEPDPVTAGERLSYEIDVTDLGPSTAENVILQDQLPDGVTFLSATVVNGTGDEVCTFAAGTNTVTCSLGDVTPIATPRVLIEVRVDADTPAGTLSNEVDVFSVSTADPDSSNNQASSGCGPCVTDTTVNTDAEVTITKTASDASPVAGADFAYTIEVENAGPSLAHNVSVEDPLPSDVEVLFITGASCTVDAFNVVTCSLGDMTPGDSHTIDIYVRLPEDPRQLGEGVTCGTTLPNQAEVRWDNDNNVQTGGPDGREASATADADVTIDCVADLRILKFGKPDGEVRAGELLTYTIIVDNLGPSFAHSVVITDELTSDGTFDVVSIDPDVVGNRAGATCTPTAPINDVNQRQTITCALNDDLEVFNPSDGSGRWMVEIVVTADQTQDIDNVVAVSSIDSDPDAGNNTATVEHDITDVADLSVTKTAVGEVAGVAGPVADQVTAGRPMTYTLTINNSGPSTAENVTLQDRLPPWIVVTGVDTSQGSCNSGTPGEPLDKLTCGLGTLGVGASATVTITADVPSWIPDGTILENDALVFSDIFDANNANDFVTNLTTVNTFADLSVSKVGEPDPVVAGELLEYTVTVTNTGPSDAIGVVVTDTLPAAVEFQYVRDPFGIGVSCSLNPIDERTLTCTLGDVPAGSVLSFGIVVRVDQDAPPVLENLITVSSGTSDSTTNDNSGSTGTVSDRAPQPFVQKSDAPDPVLAGTDLQYTLTFGNAGPSQATNVVLTDTLPRGVFFNRCESLDPNEQVTCIVIDGDGNTSGQVVRVEQILVGNVPVFTNGGTLDAGASFDFVLIADVESGYVLNGRGDTGPGEACRPFFLASSYPHVAHNRAEISADILEGGVVTGQVTDRDDECTRVNAEADLALSVTDVQGTASQVASNASLTQLSSSDGLLQAGFLNGDPVTPGGTLVYTLNVVNNGPADAAQVVLEVQLPAEGLVLDPNLVDVTIASGRGQVVEVREDGHVMLVVGNDPNNNGVPQLGRINAGTPPVVVQIEVEVADDAPCGETLILEAALATRRNDTLWPPAPGTAFAPAPTQDPNPANNAVTEETLVVCPAITIDKTVSLDGTCPGTDNVAIGAIGEPVTYCYEITNAGDTYLDFVTVTDTVTTRSGPFVIFQQTFRANPDGDPDVPLAPGDSFIIQNTEPDLDILIDCNDRPDLAQVSAVPVNRGRAVLNVPHVTDADGAVVETPCKGVDWRLQLPALNTDECATTIQVQNVGNEVTKALLVLWGEPGFCPPQAFGPLKVECTGLLRPGSAWSFHNELMPAGARSGIMYSLNATDRVLDKDDNELVFADLACGELFSLIRLDHERWLRFDEAYRHQGIFYGPSDIAGRRTVLDFGAHQGEPLAVTVNRTCPDAQDPNMDSSAAYVGISTDREGILDPRAGGFAYYAPLVWADFAGMNSILHVQNSGTECTSVEMWFQQQGNCIRPLVWDIPSLAPGESIAFDPNEVVGPGWQGSVWLSGSTPLGIIVDTLGANHFGAYHGVPANVYVDGGSSDFSLGTQVNYAPLIYREHQGWESAIQVQNLSSVYNAKVKVTFTDNSGDIIKTIVDWICPRGAQTFFLPVIAGLPGNWIGSARIESQDWTSPGDPLIDSPRILSVVMLEKYTDPAKRSRQETVVYNALQEMGSFDWQQGPEATSGFGGSTVLSVPFAAKQNRGVTSEIAIQNLNPNPGSTNFVILIYDQNRLLDQVCETLSAKQVEYIDLDQWGYFPPGYVGSLVIAASSTDQVGGAALGAVAVERIGRTQSQPDIPGDESKAFEAFPLYNRFQVPDMITCPGDAGPCTYTLFGQVTDALDGRPLAGATVTATAADTTVTATTDANGRYSLAMPAGQGFTVIEISADGYRSRSVTVASADCLEVLQQSFTLRPLTDTVTVSGRVENKATGDPIAGATVQAVNCAGGASATTATDGTYTLTLAFADACTTWVVASADGFNPSADSVMIPNGDTAILDFQIKQTPTSRVLLYYGNGGVSPADEAGPETDYTTLQDFYASLGFSVDYTDIWPTASDWPSVYKLVILLAPGHDSSENLVLDGFTTGQKARLGEFLQAGGHLVVLSDHSAFTGQAVENDLLAGLPVDLAFNSNSWADGLGDQITPDCVTDGVGTIDADQWTDVTSPGNAAVPGALVLQNASANPIDNCPNCAIVMSDVPAPGNGRVTIVGDLNFADDASRLGTPPPFSWSANNTQLIFNFLACP